MMETSIYVVEMCASRAEMKLRSLTTDQVHRSEWSSQRRSLERLLKLLNVEVTLLWMRIPSTTSVAIHVDIHFDHDLFSKDRVKHSLESTTSALQHVR